MIETLLYSSIGLNLILIFWMVKTLVLNSEILKKTKLIIDVNKAANAWGEYGKELQKILDYKLKTEPKVFDLIGKEKTKNGVTTITLTKKDGTLLKDGECGTYSKKQEPIVNDEFADIFTIKNKQSKNLFKYSVDEIKQAIEYLNLLQKIDELQSKMTIKIKPKKL